MKNSMLIRTEASSCEHVHSLPEEVGVAVNTKAAVLENMPNNTVKSSPFPSHVGGERTLSSSMSPGNKAGKKKRGEGNLNVCRLLVQIHHELEELPMTVCWLTF